MNDDFPFSPAGSALLCDWTDDDYGLGRIHWAHVSDEREPFSATVGLVDRRNVLRFAVLDEFDAGLAAVAGQAVDDCLRASALSIADVDAIIAAPARSRYRTALATRLDAPAERIVIAEDEGIHTASLAAAFDRASHSFGRGANVLLVAAGAGLTAGAGLYRLPR